MINRFVNSNLELGIKEDKYITIQKGNASGELIGGNISLLTGMISGKYALDFSNRILFIEELGYESSPEKVSNNLYYMKQNGVFDKINGIWIGNYEHESQISLEKIIADVLELPNQKYSMPILKSNNFGHTDKKTTIPIGIKAQIDTNEKQKIKLLENCVR